MGSLFTALSVKQYAELLSTKNIPLCHYPQNIGLKFTEDKAYWLELVQNQEDLDLVIDYEHSIIIEFEADVKTINSIIQNPNMGRLSEKIIAYYQQLEKPILLPELKETDVNVLSIMDIYKSDATEDGISQRWQLFIDTTESDLWQLFSQSIHKIVCLGAIPGAVEEAERIAL
ncbi:MAG: hypothetical protein GQ574_18370 [Crocinitomix sp.]|nr:hypothetical protein [Crocinitomix sp.]